MKNIFKRATALLLSLLMVFSVCSTALIVYAEDGVSSSEGTAIPQPKTIKYVSIGDSMTNGYGLEGYEGQSGLMNYGINTYANKFAAWLAGYNKEIENDQVIFTGTKGTVDHRQLAFSGMRAEDLHWLLDLDYKDTDLMIRLAQSWVERNKAFGSSFDWEEAAWAGDASKKDIRDYWYMSRKDSQYALGQTAGDQRTWYEVTDPSSGRLGDGVAKMLYTYYAQDSAAKGYFTSDYAKESMINACINGVKSDFSETSEHDFFPNGTEEQNTFYSTNWLQVAGEFYQESVADADVISLALGNTNFGTWMFDWMQDIFAADKSATFEDLTTKANNDDSVYYSFYEDYQIEHLYMISNFDEGMQAKIDELMTKVEPLLETYLSAGFSEAQVEYLKYLFKYCTLSYIINYIGVVERIVALNPNVDLIQIALINAYDTGTETEGKGLSMAAVIDMLYTPLNAFIAALPTYMQSQGKWQDANFIYVDAGQVETLSEVFGNDFYKDADGNYLPYPGINPDKMSEIKEADWNSSVIRDRFLLWIAGRKDCGNDGPNYIVDYVEFKRVNKHAGNGGVKKWKCCISYGEIFKYAVGPYEDVHGPWLGKYKLCFIDKDMISWYVAMSDEQKRNVLAQVDGEQMATYEANKAFSVGFYLAIEDAIIRAGKGSIDLASFDSFGFNQEVFTPAMNLFGTKLENAQNNADFDVMDVFGLLSEALYEQPNSNTMLAIGSRMEIGTGIGGHTSVGGHETVFQALKKSFVEGYTSADETKAFLVSYLKSKYPELMEKLGAVSALGETDDLARIVMMLKLAQKNGNSALAGIDLDAIEAAIRAKLNAYKSAHTLDEQAAAQAAAYDLMVDLQKLAAKVTAIDYVPTEKSFYVSLGDSNVTGYGLDEYGYIENQKHGLLQNISVAAPVLLAKELYGDKWEDHFGQYAQGALRAEDMLAILGGLPEGFEFDAYYDAEIKGNLLYENDLAKTSAEYIDIISGADLISINIGGGNVTTFTGEQVDRVVAGEELVKMDWAKIGYTDATITELDAFLDEMVPLMDMIGLMDKYLPEGMTLGKAGVAEFARTLLESMLYGYASFNYYYPMVIARVREINPTAQIMILGMFNPIDYWTVNTNGKNINIGGIVNNIMELTNIQNLVYALQNANTSFIDLHSTETILDEQVKAGKAEYTFQGYYESILKGDGEDAHASVGGHAYMFSQMHASLTGLDIDKEVDAIVEDFYNILNSNYATTEEKLSMIGKTYALLDQKNALGKYPEVKAIADVYAFLDSKNYINNEQALAIVLKIYGEFLGDMNVIEIAKFVYETLLYVNTIDDAARIEIIVTIYNVLKADTEYVAGYAKYIEVVEALCARPEFANVSAKQTFAIVDYIYNGMFVNNDFNVKAFVGFIWNTVFGNIIKPRGGLSAADFEAFTAAEKLDILKACFEVFEDKGLLDDIPAASGIVDLYNDIRDDAVLSDEKLHDLIDKVVDVYVETPETALTPEKITEVAKEVVEDIMTDPSIPVDKKVELLNKVVDTLDKVAGDGTLGDVIPEIPSIPDVDLTIVNDIIAKLDAEGILSKDVANVLVGDLTSLLLKADYTTTEGLAKLADAAFDMILSKGFTAEQAAKIAYSVVEYLIKEGYADDAIDTYVEPYYQIALKYVLTAQNIELANYYIDLVTKAVNDAMVAVNDYAVTTPEFIAVKNALVAELAEVLNTLKEAKTILATNGLKDLKTAMKTVISLKDDLDAHITKVAILANELGIAGNYAIGQLMNIAQNYNTIAQGYVDNAYAWIVENVKGINQGYIDIVNEIVATVAKFDSALAQAVYDLMMDAPSEAIALIALYGEDAIYTLCGNAADVANDLYVAASNLVLLLKEYGIKIYSAIVNDPTCQALQDELESLNAQLQALTAAAKTAPAAQAAAIYAQIEEIKAYGMDLAGMFYDAAIAAVYAVDPIAGNALDDAIEAITNAAALVTGAAGNYADWLTGKAGELSGKIVDVFVNNWNNFADIALGRIMQIIESLKEPETYYSILDKIVEEALKVAPQLDAKIRDYLNSTNPEFVAFIERHESYLLGIVDRYGDEALGAIGVALATYGPELGEYLIENADVILAGIVEFVEKNNVQIVAVLQLYAESIGLYDKVSGEITILTEKLAQLQAEIIKQLNIVNNEICPEIAELNQQLKAATEPQQAIILEQIKILEAKKQQLDQYIAQAQAAMVQVRETIAQLTMKQQAFTVALGNLGAALKTLAVVGVENGAGAVQKALNDAAYALYDLVNVVSGNLADQLDSLIEMAKKFLNDSYNSAIKAETLLNPGSLFVAFGDNSDAVEAFVELLNAEIAKLGGEFDINYTNNAEAGTKITDLLAAIATDSSVKNADLISIGYSLNTIAEETMGLLVDLLYTGAVTFELTTTVDWNNLVGSEIASEIIALLAEIELELKAAKLDVTLADYLSSNYGLTVDSIPSTVTIADAAMTALEYFAYNVVEYAVLMPQAIAYINQINPDALIMVNAMYNPLAGVSVSLNGFSFTFGDYLDYVVDAIYVETVAVAAIYDNVVFAQTTDIATSISNDNVLDFIELMLSAIDKTYLEITTEGNADIATKMVEALDIDVENVLRGDFDGDNDVDEDDVIYLLRHTFNETRYPLNQSGDVDGDNDVDEDDVIYLLRHTFNETRYPLN